MPEASAHKVTTGPLQGLHNVGSTGPAQGGTYRVGLAMESTNYQALDPESEDRKSLLYDID